MTFRVEPDSLDALIRMIDRGADDAAAMRTHFNHNAGISFTGEGMINLLRDTDDDIENNINKYLAELATTTLPGTAAAIGQAADYYRNTDAAAAERNDPAFASTSGKSATRASWSASDAVSRHPAAQFSDVDEPTQALSALPDFNKKMPYEPSWTDISSPSGMVRDAIWAVTKLGTTLQICDRPYDIFEVALKPFLGDWAGMAASGYAMKQVASSLSSLNANLTRAEKDLQTVWAGNAADSAETHLATIRTSLANAAISLQRLGKEYEACADSVYKSSAAVGNILCDIADAAVVVAATAAAEGAIAATGVGVPIALGLSVFTLTKVYKVVAGVLAIILLVADTTSKIESADKLLKAPAGDFGKIDGSFSPPKLPQMPKLPQGNQCIGHPR